MANQTHESYSRHEAAVPSSDRSFGMVMAAAFAPSAHVGSSATRARPACSARSISRSNTAREDAFRCFMGNDLALLVVGNCIMQKVEQDPSLRFAYKNSFVLD